MFCRDLTFRPRMSVISSDQIDQIHQATLETLERTGVQMTHPRPGDLARRGSARSGKTAFASLPGWLKMPFERPLHGSFSPTAAATGRSTSRATSTGSGRASTASTISIRPPTSATGSQVMTAVSP